MPDQLLGLSPFVNLGGWLFVVLLVVVSMIRGWLYPAKQVREIINVYERLLEDKDKQISNWREAYNNSDERGDVLAENQRSLVESVKANNDLIKAVISNKETIS